MDMHTTRRADLGGWWRCAAALFAGVALALPASAGPGMGEPDGNAEEVGAADAGQYDVYWAIVGPAAHRFNLHASRIRRDFYYFNTTSVGFAMAGPHQALLDPGYVANEINMMNADIAFKIPDPNAGGFACIDLEAWYPVWEMSNQMVRAGWRSYIQTHRPGVIAGLMGDELDAAYKETFEEAAQEVFLRILRYAQQLRPNVKWGFYQIPPRTYWTYQGYTAGVRDPDAVAKVQRANDQLAWLFEEVDVVFPSIYQFYRTNEPGGNTEEENERYIRGNVEEAMRLVGNSKPVIPFVWPRYHDNGMAAGAGLGFLSEINLRQSLEVPQRLGARGVVLWDTLTNENIVEYQDHFNRRLGPRIEATLDNDPNANVNYRMDRIVRLPNGRTTIISGSAPGSRPSAASRGPVGGPPLPGPAGTTAVEKVDEPRAIKRETRNRTRHETRAPASGGAPVSPSEPRVDSGMRAAEARAQRMGLEAVPAHAVGGSVKGPGSVATMTPWLRTVDSRELREAINRARLVTAAVEER